MTLENAGFYGIIEKFKECFYIAFVKNGGIREINAGNLARELDDAIECNLDAEERTIQILLFYHCIAETIGFLPEYSFDTVERYIIEYKTIKTFHQLSPDEQTDLKKIVSDLQSKIR